VLWAVPGVVFAIAAALFLAIRGKWTNLTGGATMQTTDDAYLHADLTPLSTEVSGVVAGEYRRLLTCQGRQYKGGVS
jgi:membrane fusion protein (multidrug efflux system)